MTDSIFSKPKWFLSGAVLGSTLAFYLDPDRGRARRAQVRDRLTRLENDTRRYSQRQVQHLRHRLQGLLARAQSSLVTEKIDDETLYQRIRSELGRKVKNASAIEVDVHGGQITLKGEVEANEVHSLVFRLRRLRGVRHVHNELTVKPRAQPGDGRVYM